MESVTHGQTWTRLFSSHSSRKTPEKKINPTIPSLQQWTKLFAFCFTIMSLDKPYTHLFSPQLWVKQKGSMITNVGEGQLWIQIRYILFKNQPRVISCTWIVVKIGMKIAANINAYAPHARFFFFDWKKDGCPECVYIANGHVSSH